MSPVKEPFHFSTDLSCEAWRTIRGEDDYMALFDEANHAARGEASSCYIYSENAVDAIAELAPNAKIIAIVRRPAQMMYSLHGQSLWSGNENVFDFEEALALENERAEGKKIPSCAHFPNNLLYRHCARYAMHLEKWAERFGPDQLLVLDFDQIKSDSLGVLSTIYDFLGVDPGYQPDLEIFNASHDLTDIASRRLLKHLPFHTYMENRSHRYRALCGRVYRWLRPIMGLPTQRAPLRPGLRDQITEEFESEIARLERMFGLDLTQWRVEKCREPSLKSDVDGGA